jgi:tetratricopeptide (TPR) repeat protein
MTRVSPSRLSLSLALILAFVLAPLCSWPQQSDWDKHMKAGEKAFQSIEYAKAEGEFQAALAQTLAFPVPDLRTAETLAKLAEVDTRELKFAEAEALLKRDAAVTEAAAGPDDPRLAYALISLALDYEREGKPEEAAPLWSRSLAILKKAAKPADPAVLMEMDQAALGLGVHGSNPTAEEHIFSAILELRASLGASGPDLTFALSHLASMYERTGRYSQAEPLLTSILKMDEKDLGAESPGVGANLGRLANLYTSEGKYEAALPLLQRRLEISEKNNLPDSPSVRTRKNLETALNVMIAVPQLPELLLLQGAGPSVPGIPVRRPDQAEVFGCYKGLARGYANAGKYPEAEAMYKQIIAAEEKKADPDRPLESMVLFHDLIDFSRVYRNDHRYGDALETIRQSETVAQQIANSKFAKQNLKQTGPSVYPWLSGLELAETYREMGDTTAAAAAFERSLQMVKDLKLVPGHPKVAELLDNYATLLRDEGKYDQSEALYIRALDTWQMSRHPENAEVAATLMNYAALLRQVDRQEEAQALEARALAFQDKVDAVSPVD